MWINGLYVQKWEHDSSVKLVIIKAAGNKAFCCGGDIRGNTIESKFMHSWKKSNYRMHCKVNMVLEGDKTKQFKQVDLKA